MFFPLMSFAVLKKNKFCVLAFLQSGTNMTSPLLNPRTFLLIRILPSQSPIPNNLKNNLTSKYLNLDITVGILKRSLSNVTDLSVGRETRQFKKRKNLFCINSKGFKVLSAAPDQI